MSALRNDKGSVLVFMTLMIVLLMIMVGMGLDSGQLTYSRSMGQGAVDSAALSAVSGLPTRNPSIVEARAALFNPTSTNQTNSYVGSATNKIGSANVSYIKYDFDANAITNYAEPIATANGVRVALETSTGSAIATPAFLTPLLRLLGSNTAAANNVNVSAVCTITAKPTIPIALWYTACPANDGTTKALDVPIQMQHPTNDNQNPAGENACWTTFFDCSSGAPDIKAGFVTASSCSGNSINGQVQIGSYICQNRGQVNTVLGEAQDFFSANGMPNKWWIIPVIAGGGNCDPDNPTKIKTWAKIRPTFIDKSGNPKYIKADVICGEKLIYDDLESSLCFSHRLVRESTKGY